ncbi:hypothetical protein TNCV_1789861 [Trichonephila clavipes]|nr:hypothetical protein TNCV_1789861 [Trichonephila clavipes]
MSPHRPRKSAPTEYTTVEEYMIIYDLVCVADEPEPNPKMEYEYEWLHLQERGLWIPSYANGADARLGASSGVVRPL